MYVKSGNFRYSAELAVSSGASGPGSLRVGMLDELYNMHENEEDSGLYGCQLEITARQGN